MGPGGEIVASQVGGAELAVKLLVSGVPFLTYAGLLSLGSWLVVLVGGKLLLGTRYEQRPGLADRWLAVFTVVALLSSVAFLYVSRLLDDVFAALSAVGVSLGGGASLVITVAVLMLWAVVTLAGASLIRFRLVQPRVGGNAPYGVVVPKLVLNAAYAVAVWLGYALVALLAPPLLVGPLVLAWTCALNLVRPGFVGAFNRRASPSSDLSTAFEEHRTEFGVDDVRLQVLDTGGAAEYRVSAIGLVPGWRSVLVTEPVCASLDKDEVSFLLRRELAAHSAYHNVAYAVLWSGAVAAFLWTFALGILDVPAILVFGGVFVLVVYGPLAGRLKYRADAIAAEATGADVALNALETYGDHKGVNTDPDGVGTVVLGVPGIAARIARLRD